MGGIFKEVSAEEKRVACRSGDYDAGEDDDEDEATASTGQAVRVRTVLKHFACLTRFNLQSPIGGCCD